MAKRSASVYTVQQKLDQLREQQIQLESRRDQELLNLLHKTQSHQIDLLTLAGALLEARKAVTANPSQAEVWRHAGETFLHPKRKTKTAQDQSPAPQKAATG